VVIDEDDNEDDELPALLSESDDGEDGVLEFKEGKVKSKL
jgi:hypothetical protein